MSNSLTTLLNGPLSASYTWVINNQASGTTYVLTSGDKLSTPLVNGPAGLHRVNVTVTDNETLRSTTADIFVNEV